MSRLRTPIVASLLASALVTAFAGCRQQLQWHRDLSEAQVHQLATKYRDDWLAKNPSAETSILAHGTIQTVERVVSGWHIVFVTMTGHSPSTPEGIHDYYLHVYLKLSGELERIERGPDILS